MHSNIIYGNEYIHSTPSTCKIVELVTLRGAHGVIEVLVWASNTPKDTIQEPLMLVEIRNGQKSH